MVDLSIIIPHYNSVNTLKELLLSIPNKKNIQILVIDDKSNKDLFELERLKNQFKNVLFLNNNTNKKGAGVCRNIGLDNVVGKWVLFADADDFFLKKFYDVLNPYFKSNYDVIFFTPTSIEIDTGNKSDRHEVYEELINDYIDKKDYRAELRLRYRFAVPWSKLIKSDLIKDNNIRFDEIIASNDVMFSTRVGYFMEEFKVVTDKIYCATRGYGTLTTNTNEKIYDARVSVFIKNYKYLQSKLNEKDMNLLNFHGLGVLFVAFKNKFSIKKMILVYRLLKKNNIKIFDTRLYNPLFIIKKFKQYLNEKRYLLEK